MEETQEKRGITLISLVITIILLLILATVAISLAVDSEGLFSKAGEAANTWNTSVAEERTEFTNIINALEEQTKLTLGKVYNDDMIGQSITYSANGQSEWIILGEDSEKEGNILITTKTAVQDGIKLYGSAVKWLSYANDLHTCCSVYGGKIGEIDVEARSITIKDINRVTGFVEPPYDTYTFGLTHDYSNKKVKLLYPKTESSWTASDGTVYQNWKLPTTENEITFADDVYVYDDNKYMYRVNGVSQTMETTEHIDQEKADLIWGTANDFEYLVASTALCIMDEGIQFYADVVSAGSVHRAINPIAISIIQEGEYYGTPETEIGNVPVRPVVSLPLNLPVHEVNGVYDLMY